MTKRNLFLVAVVLTTGIIVAIGIILNINSMQSNVRSNQLATAGDSLLPTPNQDGSWELNRAYSNMLEECLRLDYSLYNGTSFSEIQRRSQQTPAKNLCSDALPKMDQFCSTNYIEMCNDPRRALYKQAVSQHYSSKQTLEAIRAFTSSTTISNVYIGLAHAHVPSEELVELCTTKQVLDGTDYAARYVCDTNMDIMQYEYCNRGAEYTLCHNEQVSNFYQQRR